jgi:C-terminal processing protease CtpA/Prc
LPPPNPNPFQSDASWLVALLDGNYAYRERLPGGKYELTQQLRDELDWVHDDASLLYFAERALLLLADHHAATGQSFLDSWSLFPSLSDLWVERIGHDYVITAVRDNSPAAEGGIIAGDGLIAVDGTALAAAVDAFWSDLGRAPPHSESIANFAAGLLAAGRRDRPRTMTVRSTDGTEHSLTLPTLTASARGGAAISTWEEAGRTVIKINDSLGDEATVAAFDHMMSGINTLTPLIIDLTDTPGGGNTVVARAILGWFVTGPCSYQVHNSPGEMRRTGIARQWVEQVLPRRGCYHAGPVKVRVGRWTGSMGEGIAIGFNAIGALITGSRMAGLLGGIETFRLPNSGLEVRFPTEKLFAFDGTPREEFVPLPLLQ